MPNTFTARGLRWVTLGPNPAVVDGSLHIPASGPFRLTDFDYDTVFSGQTGAVVSAVATRPEKGASVDISHGRFFMSDLPGHTADAAIDIEPAGGAAFDRVTVRDVALRNSSCYLTGSRHIDFTDVQISYTRYNRSGRAIPFVVFNSNPAAPPLGKLNIEDCDVGWKPDNPYDQRAAILTVQGQDSARVALRNNRYRLDVGPGGIAAGLYWVKDAALPELLIADDDLVISDPRAGEGSVLVRADAPVGRLEVHRSSVAGRFARRLVAASAGPRRSVMFRDNDFSRARFLHGDLVATSVRLENSGGPGHD